jgi:isorenieratene synthase
VERDEELRELGMNSQDELATFGRPLDAAETVSTDPDWKQADLAWIQRALRRVLSLPSGGWFVVDASRAIHAGPTRYRIEGKDYVVWRADAKPIVAPDACPHMGASLADGCALHGRVVCPWHGLALGAEGHGGWKPFPTFDDGVLVWVRIGPEDPAVPRPVLPERPARHLDAVLRREARCEPQDVIANRLDPWHGVHFHPHSFARLKVIEQLDDSITVRVVYRVFLRWGIEVDARFHCPDPHTIAMTITAGEGEGSVVETHATPIDAGRTAIIEATLATSDRPQFWKVVGALSRVLRPLVRWRAHRLWAEDAAYAERRYALRSGTRDRA